MNPALPVALFPPSVQVTVAVAGPGLRVLGFQVHDTLPLLLAICAVFSAALPEYDPLA